MPGAPLCTGALEGGRATQPPAACAWLLLLLLHLLHLRTPLRGEHLRTRSLIFRAGIGAEYDTLITPGDTGDTIIHDTGNTSDTSLLQ